MIAPRYTLLVLLSAALLPLWAAGCADEASDAQGLNNAAQFTGQNNGAFVNNKDGEPVNNDVANNGGANNGGQVDMGGPADTGTPDLPQDEPDLPQDEPDLPQDEPDLPQDEPDLPEDEPDLPEDEPDMDEPDIIDETGGPNEGWIGGACGSASDCDFDDAICMTDWPRGTCSQACDRFCPDRDGNNSVTFCIEEDGQGRCVSRCDYDLYPEGGCRQGYACRIEPRFGESTSQGVCVPEDRPAPDADTACLQYLNDNGVVWQNWAHSPETAPGTSSTCNVEDPVRVQSPISGVTYRYYSQQTSSPMSVACPLARAMVRLGAVLREFNITQVLHIGTYNCRAISGTSTISQHGLALALDIYGFVDANGQDYILERDWEHNTTNFSSAKAQLLYEVGQRMYEERIFNLILTPNYNSAHDNHFHVDLTAGSHYIGYGDTDQYYIGPNHGH
jgi:hypothetical protein